MKKKNQSLFDSIPEAAISEKEMAILALPGDLRADVDRVAEALIMFDKAKKDSDSAKTELKDKVTPIHEEACKESYQGSVRLVGEKHTLSLIRKNAFKVKTGTSLDDIEKAVGAKFKDEHFAEVTTVAVNPNVVKDDRSINAMMTKLSKVFSKEEIAEYFTKTTQIVVQGNMDEAQLGLSDRRRAALGKIMTQTAPTIQPKK